MGEFGFAERGEFVQKALWITKDQIVQLRDIKKASNVSMSFVVRKALQMYIPTLLGTEDANKKLLKKLVEQYKEAAVEER